MLRLLEEKIATPLGPLWVICDEQFRLRAVEWEEYSERMVQLLDIHYRKEGYERISATNPGGLSDKLREYFAGNLSIIDTLPNWAVLARLVPLVRQTDRIPSASSYLAIGLLAETAP